MLSPDPYGLDLHSFFVTFFPDKFAKTQSIDALTLDELADAIAGVEAPDKAKMPWLKLARFGDTRSDKGSLRTNANMLDITGIEAEHDAGTMTFDAAVEALRSANLRCLVYTTPSYVEGSKERWRVLAPLSESLPTTERKALVARLNGVLGGALADESFTLSQAYLYGHLPDAAFAVEVLDGDFIDRADGLEAGAIDKRRVGHGAGRVERPLSGDAMGYSDAEIDALLDKARVSGHWHNSMTSATSSLASRLFSEGEICQRCGRSADGGADDPELIALAKSAVAKFGVGLDRETQASLSEGLKALKGTVEAQPAEVMFSSASPFDEFNAYLPQHLYVYMPTRELWPAASIDSTLPPVPRFKPDGTALKPVKASRWLDQNKPLEQMTWLPGEAEIILDRLVAAGGVFEHQGSRVLNLYRAPVIEDGDPAMAGRWIEHLELVYPDDASHVTKWLAHRLQRPGEKINHALVLGGSPGIGKDTILEPVKRAVGSDNMQEIAPKDMMGRFNGYARSVILRISEARDLGEMSRFEFYERTKTYAAAPPDVLRIDEKNRLEYYVPNVCGLLITTNYLTDGIYLHADDRRHYVAWNRTHKKEHFDDAYWRGLWGWYEKGGYGHVAAYLRSLDISDFDPKAPPPRTEAFHAIVNANMAPEDAELDDVLDALGRPDAVTIAQVQDKAPGRDFKEWLGDRRNRRILPHRFEQCGYAPVRSTNSQQGLWRVHGARQAVYAKTSLSLREQHIATAEMIRRAEEARAASLSAFKNIAEDKKRKKGK